MAVPTHFYVAFWTRGKEWHPCGQGGAIAAEQMPHIAFSPEEFPDYVRNDDVRDWVVMEFEL